jgi:hypothetical protein
MKRNKYFTIAFYRYYFFKARNTPYGKLFFLDFRVIGIILLLLFLNAIFFLPRPVYFSFPSLDAQRNILDSLIKTISIFFGIIFSFIVLSFNIFYKNFGRYVFLAFFKSKLIRRPFTMLLSTICFLSYSLYYLKDAGDENTYSKSLYCLSLALSLVSFFSVFPAVVVLLKKSQSRNNIKSIIDRLDLDFDFEEFEVKYMDKDYDISYKNPIILLTEIGISSIKDYDFATISVLCKSGKTKCTIFQDEMLTL